MDEHLIVARGSRYEALIEISLGGYLILPAALLRGCAIRTAWNAGWQFV
jgi:hypothetical protein